MLHSQKVSDWLKVNKLSLNSNKTKFMTFHPFNKNFPKLNLRIENHDIEQVDTFDYLGITLDQHLTWKPHIEKVSKKISKVISILSYLKHFIPSQILVTIYNSLILPHLTYGLLLWAPKINSVEMLQKRAIRVIAKVKRNHHTNPLFKRFKILKINDLKTLQEYKFYYKLVNKKLPKFFDTYKFTKHMDIHSYPTRGSHQYITPRLRYQSSVCSVRFRIPTLLNEAPDAIMERISTHGLQWLCFYFKDSCLNLYPETCEKAGCNCRYQNPPV